MLKGTRVGPKSIAYKPLLSYLIWMKIGITTSSAQKILEKLQQLIHALKRLLLKFSCHLDMHSSLYKNDKLHTL